MTAHDTFSVQKNPNKGKTNLPALEKMWMSLLWKYLVVNKLASKSELKYLYKIICYCAKHITVSCQTLLDIKKASNKAEHVSNFFIIS